MFSPQVHRYIFLFGVLGLAFGMMMGTVPTSVPQIILMANWLLEGDFKRKWEQLRHNKLFWILSSVFLIHVLGLFYTSDLQAGWNDVRTKIPLMFLPLLFFSSKPLTEKEFRWMLILFLTGCVTNTLWCLAYTHLLHQNEVVRNASRFMSHIRLGLFLNVAIGVCVYFIWITQEKFKRLIFSILIVYFLFVLYALGLASGMINFFLLLVLSLCVLIFYQRPLIKIISAVLLAGFIVGLSTYVSRIYHSQVKLQDTPNNKVTEKTPWGTPYIHFDSIGQKENGNYVLINIELDELQREWKRRFPEDSFNYKSQHNIHRYEVLVRYISSKGLNKDSAGVAALTKEDQENIRKNVFNYQYPRWSFLHRRIYEFVNEFDEFENGRHINGHSATMRLYFWKAALHVIAQKPLTGVGTGDVQEAMNRSYRETHSPLFEEWYKRPHNQFLTVTVALGIGGVLIFLFSLIYPVVILRESLSPLYWPFFIIALVSFMVEDTLETQAGLSFFALFNALFISRAYWKGENEIREGE